MSSFLDPTIWMGLFTLVFLEIILSIDNVIFIAILSKKLPKNQQNKARYTGLIFALFMRFGLLGITSKLISLTKPIIINKFFIFSGKEIILLIGGIFLFIKTIFELFNHIYIFDKKKKKKDLRSSFWYIVIQIVILDVIFSIDSIMTAIGTTHNLFIMIIAVTISTILMIFLSKLLIKFINSKKSIITLCLSLLLMISLNLIIESLGFYISKKYLYISVEFSLFIEIINQIRINKKKKKESKKLFKKKILSLISYIIKKYNKKHNFINQKFLFNKKKNIKYLNNDINDNNNIIKEIKIVNQIFHLNNYSIYKIMIPKEKIKWININDSYQNIKKKLLNIPYKIIILCNWKFNEVIGFIKKEKLINLINKNKNINNYIEYNSLIFVPDSLNIINIIKILRYSYNNIILINNRYGKVVGILTIKNLFQTVFGNFLDINNTPKIILNKKKWIMNGSIKLKNLEKILKINFKEVNYKCFSLADFLIYKYKKIPKTGKIIIYKNYYFKILKSNLYKIYLIQIKKNDINTKNKRNY
ncbi:TerC family protein [Buchnera aphidicola]|uniref:Putative transmembrane protein n=1 Tax=Buchnera aphidicola subsp. Cinara cedri (strain Cc) TaxID=372461 RepID=Q057M6_BUCCC|nr:transporter associated domain-containing protein [Buchnera aphidicola]ABJ90673.1 putative transmembrane protein [Buchnera aphidicola BCc]